MNECIKLLSKPREYPRNDAYLKERKIIWKKNTRTGKSEKIQCKNQEKWTASKLVPMLQMKGKGHGKEAMFICHVNFGRRWNEEKIIDCMEHFRAGTWIPFNGGVSYYFQIRPIRINSFILILLLLFLLLIFINFYRSFFIILSLSPLDLCVCVCW